VLVRTGTTISEQVLLISEQEFNEDWEKWLVKASVLEEWGALNGGHDGTYKVGLSNLQVEGKKLLSQFGAPESPVLLRWTAENDSMISGEKSAGRIESFELKKVLAELSPSNLPGSFTLFAPAVSCLAQDGVAGGHSPFVSALLSWFRDARLVKYDVLDRDVRHCVDYMVQTTLEFRQQPEWNHSGKVVFRFSGDHTGTEVDSNA